MANKNFHIMPLVTDVNFIRKSSCKFLTTILPISHYLNIPIHQPFLMFNSKNIRLLISDYTTNNATEQDILSAIKWLKNNAKKGDEVVFFYSGHGARGKANDGDKELIDEAIVPWECTAESLIWDGELAALFSDFATSRIIFIFDSCYAGGMTDLKAEGRIVVMACSENGLSYEFENFQNGQFTYYPRRTRNHIWNG